ncbi:MAG: protein-glutamate O-methyltransferase CheR, partial [Silvanigrellaceae bacterium]|nr:protein-glutamate O-methyltransferase CheR [Silvanigrellaceae bacterium]
MIKISQEILLFFANYIQKELGIVYEEKNYYQLEHRLVEITKLLDFAHVEELWLEAKKGISGSFKELLLDLATNNETSFFRDQSFFKNFKKHIENVFTNEKAFTKGLRIWSAACSSGQEPYSIAMLLSEIQGLQFSILASDISQRVLKKAQSGQFSQLEVQRGLNALELIKYFNQNESQEATTLWTIKPYIKSFIRFEKRNLLDNWAGFDSFDFIFCRNVLIYQSIENRKKVIEKIYNSLVPGGCLIMGAGESLLGISNEFTLV